LLLYLYTTNTIELNYEKINQNNWSEKKIDKRNYCDKFSTFHNWLFVWKYNKFYSAQSLTQCFFMGCTMRRNLGTQICLIQSEIREWIWEIDGSIYLRKSGVILVLYIINIKIPFSFSVFRAKFLSYCGRKEHEVFGCGGGGRGWRWWAVVVDLGEEVVACYGDEVL